MGNPLRGETPFEAGGQTYLLLFSVDAICQLEDRVDKSIGEILVALARNPRVSLLRSILWAGLQERQPKLDERAAGELIGDVGDIGKVVSLIGEAFARAFPAAQEGGAEDPPPAGAVNGTGPASSASGASTTAARRRSSGAKPRASVN